MDPKTSEKAREFLTQKRQEETLRQEAMHVRAEEGLQHAAEAVDSVEAKARAAMASQLQEADQLREAMLERSEEELAQD